MNQKVEARKNIVEALTSLKCGNTERLVRINQVGSGLETADIEAVLSGPVLPDGIVLPKVESPEHLQWLDAYIEKKLGTDSPLCIIALIESATAMLRLGDITRSSKRLVALIFGADDYAADVGAVRTPSNEEVSFARNLVLLHAKAAKLQAIDLVNIEFKNPERLERECLEAFRMGYTGKQIIHPAQIGTVHRCFAPDRASVEWAQSLIAAWHQNQAAGAGAFTFQNKMIDRPTVLQAEQLVARARACGMLETASPSSSSSSTAASTSK